MWLPKFRLKTLMIMIAIMAPLLAGLCGLIRLNTALEEFYGQDGFLEREQQCSSAFSAGQDALKRNNFAEAEGHLRSALTLSQSTFVTIKYPVCGGAAGPTLALADALSGLGRDREAEEFYQQTLAIRRQSSAEDDPFVVEALEHRSAARRKAGANKGDPIPDQFSRRSDDALP